MGLMNSARDLHENANLLLPTLSKPDVNVSLEKSLSNQVTRRLYMIIDESSFTKTTKSLPLCDYIQVLPIVLLSRHNMAIKISMDAALESILVLKARLVVVLVIAILGNWEVAKGNNEHTARKYAVDNNPGT